MIDKRCNFIEREFSEQDIYEDGYKEERAALKHNYIKPYTLKITTNDYVGNFERELIAYVFGVLDGVQMKIDFASKEIEKYYQEEDEFVRKNYPKNYSNDYYDYESGNYWLDKFYEFFTAVDDWHQITFYEIAVENRCALNIYFNEKPTDDDLSFIKKRVEKFFTYVIEYANVELLSIKLVDCNENELYYTEFVDCYRREKKKIEEETNSDKKEKPSKYEEVLKLIVEKNFNIYLFKLTEKRMADASVESKTFFFNLFATSDEEILTVEEYTSIKNAIDEVSKMTA